MKCDSIILNYLNSKRVANLDSHEHETFWVWEIPEIKTNRESETSALAHVIRHSTHHTWEAEERLATYSE